MTELLFHSESYLKDFEATVTDVVDGGVVLDRTAFYTGGGISTLPFRYEGRIEHLSYKTLRYPGHAAIMKAARPAPTAGDRTGS